MNRTDRLYAVVEELRAAGSRGRTARQLADHFEVSVRTIERDLSALGQAGVPIATRQGRHGGFTIDRSMSLPPLNFTPREAAAVAAALSRSGHALFAGDARSALQKIVAVMPDESLREARATLEQAKRLCRPVPDRDLDVATIVWQAFCDNRAMRIHYVDLDGIETEREIEPQQVIVGATGSFLAAWCHLREDDRVFRMDRITRAEPARVLQRRPQARADDRRPAVTPASPVRFEEFLPKTDMGLSRASGSVGRVPSFGG